MTILQSLKKLHKKMTGQDTTNKTISGVLDSIQENYQASSSDSSLPNPSTAGNVLTSTGSNWTSAAPNSPYIVELVEQSNTVSFKSGFTMDWDKFNDYINNEKQIIIKLQSIDINSYVYLYKTRTDNTTVDFNSMAGSTSFGSRQFYGITFNKQQNEVFNSTSNITYTHEFLEEY